MIKIEIVADSAEEARKEMSVLIGTTIQSSAGRQTLGETQPVQEESKASEPEKPKATRQRATTPAPVETPVPVQSDPLSNSAPAPVQSDPLGASAPVADPLANSAPAADPLSTPAKQDTGITLQTVRDKIGTLGDKKQQVKDLVATYKQANGQPCEKPSDLQEKDFATILADLDYI